MSAPLGPGTAARLAVAAALAVALAAPAAAQSERVVEVASRGQAVRMLLIEPAKPVGSVVLLAGGHGNLAIAPDGAIGWGAGNQLVRTRADYAAAGFVTAVPDIAPDLKRGGEVVLRYRFDAPHAQDIGAVVAYLRARRAPVAVVATSRGSLSAANAMKRLSGAQRPDLLVLTSPYLAEPSSADGFVRRLVGDDPAALNLPTLVVVHAQDGCRETSPAALPGFKAWYERNGRKLDTVVLTGGAPGRGDPCQANSAHGFLGLDDKVVAAVAAWLRQGR